MFLIVTIFNPFVLVNDSMDIIFLWFPIQVRFKNLLESLDFCEAELQITFS
jgi:hypothetical protein